MNALWAACRLNAEYEKCLDESEDSAREQYHLPPREARRPGGDLCYATRVAEGAGYRRPGARGSCGRGLKRATTFTAPAPIATLGR